MQILLVGVGLDDAEYATLTKNIGTITNHALWTAAEPSVTVTSACLPSLRPLFARALWIGSDKAKMSSQSSHMGLASSRPNGKGKHSYDGSFNRLPEASGGSWGWSNNIAVAVHGGHGAGSEEYEIGEADPQPNAPLKSIMVKTTVVQEIHERLNYHDELF